VKWSSGRSGKREQPEVKHKGHEKATERSR
jgi:hypothetical protein